MRRDEMEEMFAHDFARRLSGRGEFRVGLKPPPEFVDKLDPDRDVAEQFAEVVMGLTNPAAGNPFPRVCRNREREARAHEVPIQPRVGRGERRAGAHHLRGVFEQAAAPRVMVVAGRRRAPELSPYSAR